MFTVGLLQVPVKVTALLVVQLVAWLFGFTEVVGAVVYITTANVCEEAVHAVPLDAVTV
jgi:hypothetical protein